MISLMQPLTNFLIPGPLSYLLSVVEVSPLLLKGFGMIAWKRKTNFKGGLDPLVKLEKRILPYLPSSRRERGLKEINLRRMVTSLTFGVSNVIS
jgi:hypothetical protein